MANAREIQGRIKSINDTMKITNAMYMISSTKLQRAKKELADDGTVFLHHAEHDCKNRSSYAGNEITGI